MSDSPNDGPRTASYDETGTQASSDGARGRHAALGSEPEAAAPAPAPPEDRRRGAHRGNPIGPSRYQRLLALVLLFAAVAVAGVAAVRWGDDAERGAQRQAPASQTPTDQNNANVRSSSRAGIIELLHQRSLAVETSNRSAFLALVDPTAEDYRSQQAKVFDRLVRVPLSSWSYELVGEGPALPHQRSVLLPKGSRIVRVRLTYRFDGNTSPVEREQYLTVVPRGGHWLLAGDDDAASSGLATERDIWDLGPVQVVRGKSSLVLGDASQTDLRKLAGEADRGVQDVSRVWSRPWSRHPVVVYPSSQDDMATLIGSDGKGLAQIAAVTTGSFESGLSRGDRVVVNPAAWRTLGSLGRRVVLAHEMTHLATRAITVDKVPIWLSEGFADYVAYRAVKVPTNVVASDLLDEIRDGKAPSALPDDADFDASRGDIAAAYEGAWLACRMIAEQYGQAKLISLYVSLADSKPAPAAGDIQAQLGISEQVLVRRWRSYLVERAKT